MRIVFIVFVVGVRCTTLLELRPIEIGLAFIFVRVAERIQNAAARQQIHRCARLIVGATPATAAPAAAPATTVALFSTFIKRIACGCRLTNNDRILVGFDLGACRRIVMLVRLPGRLTCRLRSMLGPRLTRLQDARHKTFQRLHAILGANQLFDAAQLLLFFLRD